ncbi:hypothetical protein K474DRAFT_1733093 [Panus rudis PR-1116 ss-1]|nr:hypothetical protein K474DRAFT_1733093 [Panus rudis PR-1116 ss-1]
MGGGDKDPPAIYKSQPPEWLPKVHATSDLGYTGFYPPRPDQTEEVLTESNIKHGLQSGFHVSAENFSARDTVQGGLVTDHVLVDLADFMNQVFSRRLENAPPIPPTSFRLPSRVTLNDAKRQSWFADLANPDVPLHKLGKSVPHGAKGHDLLDLLHTNNVAIPRAVWFLRVFGGNETAGLRNKPSYNPTQYSIEWANVVTGYLRKQLADIALPMAPRAGFSLNIKQTFKGVLSDMETRERWISRFNYSLNLLRSFYSEGLVDNRTFLAWLVQQMNISNLAQLTFVAGLADEFLDGMLVTRAITRPFIEACMNRLSELQSAAGREHLTCLQDLLKNLIVRTFIALPDSFVSPRMWMQHETLLHEVLSDYMENYLSSSGQGKMNAQALCKTILNSFIDVQVRNEAMFLKDLPTRPPGALSSALNDIKLLNSLSGQSDMSSVSFFHDVSDESPEFAQKLDVLLTWSVTPLQYGDHRPYAVASLLRCWREEAGERAIRRGRVSPDEFIQDKLFDWLDSSPVAAESNNIPNVALLFGQLVKDELFSYPLYVQRLVARGELGLSFSEENGSRHRNFLRWIPLHSSSSALIMHRKVTLYGARARQIPEDANEREIRAEIRALLPELFGGREPLPVENYKDGLETSCGRLFSAPRYEQVRVVHEWLLPNLKKNLMSQRIEPSSTDISWAKTYCVSTVLMAHCKCYGTMLELTLFALEYGKHTDLLTVVIWTLRQHMEMWACMNKLKDIANSLYAAHHYWRGQGVNNADLMNLLIEVDNGRYLDQAARDQVLTDKAAYANALAPVTGETIDCPAFLSDIPFLTSDSRPEAPSNLANSLWYKYRTAPNWAWVAWDNTVSSIREIPSVIPGTDVAARRACALRYAAFLTHVEHHLPSGFDDHVLRWFEGPGKDKVASFSAEEWDVITVVLLQLSVNGALATTTILEGVAYPVWLLGASANSPQQGQSLSILLTAVKELCNRLLLNTECGVDYPPANFCEACGLQTRRRDVYREPHFASLIRNTPILVLLEENAHVPHGIRASYSDFRRTICSMNVFRQGVYRDLDTVNRAFERVLEDENVPIQIHEALINALRLMLGDGQAGEHTTSAALSPWKLAATFMEDRFSMKQLSSALNRDATRRRANELLDQRAAKVFHQDMTSEQSDFVAQMMKDLSVPIAGKLILAGLRRMIELLDEFQSSSMEDLANMIPTAGEVLRLLSSIAQSLRNAGQAIPTIEDPARDKLMISIFGRLDAADRLLGTEVAGTSSGLDLNRLGHTITFLLRLVQFNLGVPGVWTSALKDLCEHFCHKLARMLLYYGSGVTLDPVIFALTLDTMYYMIDDYPLDPKAASPIPLNLYPPFELRSLPPSMPNEFRKRIRAILPYVALNAAVANLAYASQDATGHTLLTPVQNRPWEWTENLGDPAPGQSKSEDQEGEERTSVKNSASLSLELFATRITNEHVIVPGERDGKTETTIRTFQDDLSSETIYQRDWRESRVPLSIGSDAQHLERAEHTEETGPLPSLHHHQIQLDRRSASRRPSPASSIRSRGSAAPRQASVVSSLRASPALPRFSTGSTAGDPIDVDSIELETLSQTGSKRKSSTVDSDVEIIEVPSATSKRGKGKAAAKPRQTKRR